MNSESSNIKRCIDPIRAKFVAERTRDNLVRNLSRIQNVDDWVAKEAGCSESWLARCTKMHYGKTPNAILKEERFVKIQDVILKHSESTAAFVAGQVAPHWDERRLYNFLRRYRSTNFTKLRRELLAKYIDGVNIKPPGLTNSVE